MKIAKTKAPHIDFSLQFRLAYEKDVELSIVHLLKDISNDVSSGKIDAVGAIVVLGDLNQNNGIVEGMVQMKPQLNPIGEYINIAKNDARDLVLKFSSDPFDGAIVVEKSGQIVGAGVYLTIEHPNLKLPDGCGTRHKAAASFSLRDDIVAAFTLSEENNIVRVWMQGEVIDTLD